MRVSHPFAVWAPEFDILNVVDDLNRRRCGECGMPRGMHPEDEPDQILDSTDLRRPF